MSASNKIIHFQKTEDGNQLTIQGTNTDGVTSVSLTVQSKPTANKAEILALYAHTTDWVRKQIEALSNATPRGCEPVPSKCGGRAPPPVVDSVTAVT